VLALQVSTSPVPHQIATIGFLTGDWEGKQSGASVQLRVDKGPGGRSLTCRFNVSATGIKSFRDEGFLWWDHEAGAYRSFAMSSISNEPRREIGKFVDSELVLVSEPFEVDGRTERTRRSFSKTANGIKCQISIREGEAWKTRLNVQLTKRRS
jgi:hypothetical protein